MHDINLVLARAISLTTVLCDAWQQNNWDVARDYDEKYTKGFVHFLTLDHEEELRYAVLDKVVKRIHGRLHLHRQYEFVVSKENGTKKNLINQLSESFRLHAIIKEADNELLKARQWRADIENHVENKAVEMENQEERAQNRSIKSH